MQKVATLTKKALDQVLVIDIESTCWEGSIPQGQESEIIEIGICTVDMALGKRHEKRSILVKPEHSSVSKFCTELTTLTQPQVNQGVSFAEACSMLKKEYASKDRIWISYGDYDRHQFERQCKAYTISYPFGPGHINLKALFALLHALPYQVGLTEAVQILNLPWEGTHHRGDDDAWNIAGVFSEILRRYRTSFTIS